jgi:hypothetical protein
VTTCGFTSPGGERFLGEFQSTTFASSDPAVVLQFCLDNFVNRQ